MIKLRDILLPLQMWCLFGLVVPLIISLFGTNLTFLTAGMISYLLVNMLYIIIRVKPAYLGKRNLLLAMSSKQAGSAALLSWTVFALYTMLVERQMGVDMLIIWFVFSIIAFYIPLFILRKLFPNARRKKLGLTDDMA